MTRLVTTLKVSDTLHHGLCSQTTYSLYFTLSVPKGTSPIKTENTTKVERKRKF